MIYLDSAATSLQKPNSVSAAMLMSMKTMSSPGRGAHGPSMLAAETVYKCRCAASELFDISDPERVVFNYNATHSLNIAIRSVVNAGDRVVISGYEHNSVTRVLKHIGAIIDVVDTPLFDKQAAIDEFDKKISGASAVVCTHVSNVFGYILPIDEIANICKKRSVPLIVDASQSAGCMKVSFRELNPAFIAMPGHKGLLGPQGTGILICGDIVKPMICGGTGSDSINQEMPEFLPDMLEAGTHNVTGIAGLLEGINYVISKNPEIIACREQSMAKLAAQLIKKIDGIEVFDYGVQAGVLSFRHENIDCESICAGLSANGVAVRGGLHCAPLAHMTAGTLKTGTVRMSFSPFTEKKQIFTACEILSEVINST